MRYLLDTNICIYLLNGRFPEIERRLADCPAGDAAMSVITYAELRRGLPERGGAEASAVSALARAVPPLPFLPEAAEIFGRLPAVARTRINFDRLIASHAISLGLILVTNNERDFADIPNLEIENWTQP